ncbi:hypothetical protein A2631_02815 [Candidatus Daviesbacteria bacterium RIFCSPHIGHO2_01_FULL_44_29]|uniref:Glycosyltransferase RgtA/B/C/D-like domain-containing protein n=1 Tax=Candidatus Daviesbacteria bacterium RIFCSPHIGHO2_02_FULL_43_12 TaxID=1797776 RepID=A0A1F5KK54_9BACT|nr:MAG: hypothetical protein A2631_02815 [Candidatus Daviesbacteria bacterium RIFCSPHIGHO2_01_FULL_44_29]OGE40831.1 MAG: hypothetical protein A3E86_02535 [Candidatus Daviesbacteria bacterium RIFCSPHIGHO2_12_FULL_47_45]OGE41316.1 MAG: hypothetical protein A3D25_02210 [Candidatus Daviesbacteria bacterium RIFCSPHIGHO2_02_FULL_43_12]OGE69517.1 MAG: hypothetical protein A3B55_03950 [Candidatus Daviesbacteria bacterium RIFCSPLOWO2_01_FULL_43_15]
MTYKIFISLLISCLVLLALLTRLGSYLDFKQLQGPSLYFYSIGSGSDQDYQIKTAWTHFTQHNATEVFTHYDYLFMLPLMILGFGLFGFIGGLKSIVILNLVIGVATIIIPVLVGLSLKRHSIGVFFIAFALIFNQIMIYNSSGRFLNYPLVSFFFVCFIFIYYKALEKKSFRWVVALGVIALLEGLSKPFLFINDIPLLIIFPFCILVQRLKWISQAPFIKISLLKSKRLWVYSFLPLIILLGLSIGYEIWHLNAFGKPSYLGDTFLPSAQKGILRDQVLGQSLLSSVPIYNKLMNILTLMLMGARETIHLSGDNIGLILLGLVMYVYKKRKKRLQAIKSIVIAISVIAIVIKILSSTIFLNNPFTQVPTTWVRFDFLAIAIFIVFMYLFMTTSRLFFATGLMKLFYLFALSMTLTAVNQPQLYVSLIIWHILCIGLFLDFYLADLLHNLPLRVYGLAIFMLVLVFLSSFIEQTKLTVLNMQQASQEREYLQWVGQVLPSDAIILGGSSDNLIWLSEYTKKEVAYNSFYVPMLIKPDANMSELQEFSGYSLTYFPQFVKEKVNSVNNLFILDEGLDRWNDYLSRGGTESYPKGVYRLKKVLDQPSSQREVYQLEFNP